ncbi:MAG TPA: hypothetical protein PKA10_01680 [Selenomonadales bacterium]|nr:hypothetical protein [Selenomonadales bacterium]
MSEILYWAIITAIAFGTGWLINGFGGAMYLGFICILGGVFLYLEHKIHPNRE